MGKSLVNTTSKANIAAKKEAAKSGIGGVDEYTRGYIDSSQEKLREDLSNELKEKIKLSARQSVDEIKKETKEYIEKTQSRNMEILVIFVTLFTFISVNINIFNKTRDLYSASAFMVLMAIVIMLFTIPILMILRDRSFQNSKFLLSVFAISIILLITILIVSKYLNIPLNVNS